MVSRRTSLGWSQRCLERFACACGRGTDPCSTGTAAHGGEAVHQDGNRTRVSGARLWAQVPVPTGALMAALMAMGVAGTAVAQQAPPLSSSAAPQKRAFLTHEGDERVLAPLRGNTRREANAVHDRGRV